LKSLHNRVLFFSSEYEQSDHFHRLFLPFILGFWYTSLAPLKQALGICLPWKSKGFKKKRQNSQPGFLIIILSIIRLIDHIEQRISFKIGID